MIKLQTQYNQVKDAWDALKLPSLPKLTDIKKAITPEIQKALDKEEAQLVIAPAITEDFSMYDLASRYDKQSKTKAYIYKDLWDEYDFTSPISIEFVLMTGGSDYDEPGLVYTSKTAAKQREVLKKDGYESISPQAYVILQTIHKGKLDEKTFTRLVQFPNKSVDGDSYVPVVDSVDRQLKLGGSDVGYGWDSSGVRRVLRVNLDFTPSPEPLPFDAQEELAKLFQDSYQKGYDAAIEKVKSVWE